MIEAYGEEGRHFYTIVDFSADLIYPLSTALLFSLLTYISSRAFVDNDRCEQSTDFSNCTSGCRLFREHRGCDNADYLPCAAVCCGRVTSLMTSVKWLSIAGQWQWLRSALPLYL